MNNLKEWFVLTATAITASIVVLILNALLAGVLAFIASLISVGLAFEVFKWTIFVTVAFEVIFVLIPLMIKSIRKDK